MGFRVSMDQHRVGWDFTTHGILRVMGGELCIMRERGRGKGRIEGARAGGGESSKELVNSGTNAGLPLVIFKLSE